LKQWEGKNSSRLEWVVNTWNLSGS